MNILDRILAAMDERGGVIIGTENFASLIGRVNSKPWLIRNARLLEQDGTIVIIPSRGGRGNKTIYRKNRNSPGSPRHKAAR